MAGKNKRTLNKASLKKIFHRYLTGYMLLSLTYTMVLPVFAADKTVIETPQNISNGEETSISDTIYQNVSEINTYALTNDGTISELTGVEFNNNIALKEEDSRTYAGGGLLNNGEITLINDSSFVNNGYYGLHNNGHIGTILNTEFNGNNDYITYQGQNYINTSGYGLYNDENGVIDIIEDSTFTFDGNYNETADVNYSNAVALQNEGEIGTIKNGKFTNNYSIENNGSITYHTALENDGEINTIEQSLFQNNGYGIHNNGHIELIENSEFNKNEYYGIYNNNGYIEIITNSSFLNNKTGIQNYDTIYKITDNTFNDNGAGIDNNGSIDNIAQNTFEGNQTAIQNRDTIYEITNNTFNGNIQGIINGYGSNRDNAIIDNIAGTFVQNGQNMTNKGAAIENYVYMDQYGSVYGATINNIQGEFSDNSVFYDGNSYVNNIYDKNAYGGAIFNSGKINLISNSKFTNNSASTALEGANAYGGAIYSGQEIYYGSDGINMHIDADILNIKKQDGTFETIAFAYDSSTDAPIDYDKYKELVSLGVDVTTHTETVSEKEILEELGIDNINILIEDMVANGATKEDVLKYYTEHMPDENVPEGHITISNSSFIDNFAQSDNGEAKGGAVYSNRNLKISANNGYHSLISGNYTISNGIKDENAIHMAPMEYEVDSTYDRNTNTTTTTYKKVVPSLILDANTEGIIQIDDKISGEKADEKEWQIIETDIYDNEGHHTETITEEKVLSENKDQGYKIYITGDNTGTVILNNDVEGEADMYLYQTTLKLGKRDDVLKNNNMTFNSGTFDMVNNTIGSTNFNTLTLNDNIKTKADVDLINETMDRITSDNYIINENKLNDKLISVDYLNLLNDSTKDSVKILYADEEISSNVEYTGSNPIQVSKDKIAYSPIYKYTVSYDIDENDNMGYFTFNRGNINDSDSYNPSVLAPSVSSQAGAYTTQLQTLEYAFKHSDAFMALPSFERMAIINADRYALTPTSDATDIGTFSPLMTKLDVSGFWVKPYTSFESIPLDNGPKVSNISYGTLVGYDSNLKHLKNGWERVLTGYIGYNGASQRYSGIDTYQNGGILGLTTTFYKNNFFNATTISTGATVGNSSTYYGDEDYTMLTAGIGNKFGYNFEFKDGKFILQPNLLLSYTFINTFDYTNAAGLKIKSDPLHALQIAPGIKFIMNTESGWQPYLRADMIWNILDKTKVTANDVRLPEMSIDPYVQYGIGVQKLFKNERLTFFGQALVQNGGRNGVSLNAGLRWAVGRGK